MKAAAAVPETCTWCGTGVAAADGFRLADGGTGDTAVFCRLEHVIPWLIKGTRWDASAGEPIEPGPGEPAACAWCDRELGAGRIVLVRHRGEHRISDGFCGLDHLGAWAKAGGRFR